MATTENKQAFVNEIKQRLTNGEKFNAQEVMSIAEKYGIRTSASPEQIAEKFKSARASARESAGQDSLLNRRVQPSIKPLVDRLKEQQAQETEGMQM